MIMFAADDVINKRRKKMCLKVEHAYVYLILLDKIKMISRKVNQKANQ